MSLLLQLSKAASVRQQVAPPSNSLLHNAQGGATYHNAAERPNHLTLFNDSASDLDMSPGSEDVRTYHHPLPPVTVTTYASCYGLPYQDHNYGAPPPPTPPASPPRPIVQTTPAHLVPLSSTTMGKMNGHIDVEDISGVTEITTSDYGNVLVPAPLDNNMDDSVTRCVCDFQHDDGYMICCDRCSVWQHVDCMGVDRNNIPDNYMCELCDPRRIDKQRAVQIQTRKRRELAHLLDTSATESENETKTLGIDPRTGKKIKGWKKKERDQLLSKGMKNKKLTKKLRDKKDKFKQKQHNKLQLNKRPKFGADRRPFRRNNKVAPLPPVSLPLPIKDNVKDPYAWENSPVESFEEARINQYSSDVLGVLASRKFNGQHNSDTSPREQLRVQLCRISQVSITNKGLEAAEDVSCDRPLIEYKGKVMLREQYDKENVFFKHSHPFVLFYSKFEDLDLCVDASSYGNDARFVRRSCTPNAEVRHYIENGKLHFYVCSLKSICNGAEISIPFDYNYQDCSFPVECACTKSSCPITRFHRKVDGSSPQRMKKRRLSSKSQVKSPALPSVSSGDEGPKSSPPKSPVRLQPVQPSSVKRRKVTPLSPIKNNNKRNQLIENEKSPAIRRRSMSGPKSPAPGVQHFTTAAVASPKKELRSPGSQADKPSTDSSPESEPQRKLTREERKMEAIMKAFQKMEEREHRRQEAIHRQDSTPASPPPMTPTHKAAPRIKSGKTKSTEDNTKHEPSTFATNTSNNQDVKEQLKMEPVVVIENRPTTTMNGEVQVRGPTLRSSTTTTMPRTKAASKAMPPQIAAMEAAEAAAAAAALAASKSQEASSSSSQLQAANEVKIGGNDDEEKYEPPKTRKGKRKRMSSGPARRKSRMSSNASAASSTIDASSSADESSNPAYSQPPSEATTPTPMMAVTKTFQFPKTKKHLMKEWLYEKGHEVTKPLSIRTDSLDIEGNVSSVSTEDSVEFVQCLPSPSTNALSHLRRSSMSNCSNMKDAASSVVSNMGSSMGSAKKRWLRKAMFEQPGTNESMSPVPSGNASPNPNSCSNSPGGSPPVANDFVTPLKKRRMARASMCAELPTFTSAPGTPIPESPLTLEHRSYSVGGESQSTHRVEFTVPLLDAASLQPPSEGGLSARLPNGFRPPPHRHLSGASARSSTDSVFERVASAEKLDSVVNKQDPSDNSESFLNASGDTTISDVEQSPGRVKTELPSGSSPVKIELSTSSMNVLETRPSEQFSSVKVEPESTETSTTESCLMTSSPVRVEGGGGTNSNCSATLSPVRADRNFASTVHTAATGSSPVRLTTDVSPVKIQSPESTEVNSSLDWRQQEHRTRHHQAQSDSSSQLNSSAGVQQADSAVPTCSSIRCSDSGADSTHRERESNSPRTCASEVTAESRVAMDSDMDTQVDVVSHSEPWDRNAPSDDILSSQTDQVAMAPGEQQGSSQGFEVMLDTDGSREQPSSQVDSSEGSIQINREHHHSGAAVCDEQVSRSRHQSSDSVVSSRSRHQSAADSVAEHIQEINRPDSRQEHQERCSLNARFIGEEPDTVQAEPSSDGAQQAPEQSNSVVQRPREVEEGEVSEEEEEQVGSSGAEPQPREQEIEEGEIVDSEEEKETRDSPTSSSTNALSQAPDALVTDSVVQQQQQEGSTARDEQAVSCSTDSGVEVSSGEDLNHSAEWVSDGEVVQSSGIATTSTTDPNLPRTNSQNQISSSDHASSQTVSAASAEISSDNGALQTCSSTDNLVGSSNRTAGLFSCRLSSSSLTSSSSVEVKEGSSDTEVDSTSSHWQTVGRSGVHPSRSPADVSSSSSLSFDSGVSNSRMGTFTARWPSGVVVSDPIPEEPSSSEAQPDMPHASTTFLCGGLSSSAYPSSTTNTSPAPQSKKKVSLLEYRKRMKSRSSIDESSASRFSERSNSLPTLPNTTLGAHLRSLRDTLVNRTANNNSAVKTKASSSADLRRKDEKRPLSGRSTPSSCSGGSNSGRITPSLPSLPLFTSGRVSKGASGKDEGGTDVRWSINPTAAERICEHSNVSLTERLRRDFGIDATESDEDEKGGDLKAQSARVVYVPHHSVSIPVGVQIPPVAAGGLPGGGTQLPLPPPPQPPLGLQQPPVLVPPVSAPQPPPPVVTNSTPNGGHIPSLLSLPVAPPKSFTPNVVGGQPFEGEDNQMEDVPPPPPPPIALQSFIQQQPPPVTSGFPSLPASISHPQAAPVQQQTFTQAGTQQQPNPAYPLNLPGAGPDPFSFPPAGQPTSAQPGSSPSAFNAAPSKGKSSKKSFHKAFSGKKFKHH